MNQADLACVLVRLLGLGQVEDHRHLLVIPMAQVSSGRKLTFGLKAQQCRLSRRAAGKGHQVLCSHDHEVLLDRKASNDLLATHHKRDLEGHLRPGQMAVHRLPLLVPLRALLL